MKTNRELQFEAYYNKVKELDNLVKELNATAKHLGVETRFTDLRLYKEQTDKLEEITAYFSKVNMTSDNNTTEAILTISLREFHKFIKSLDR